jgi:hypothetical protein
MFAGLSIGDRLGQDGGGFGRGAKGMNLSTGLAVADGSKAFDALDDFGQGDFGGEAVEEVEGGFFVTYGFVLKR